MLLWHSGRLKPREYCFCKYFLVKYVNAWKIDQESFRKRSLMLKCASLGLDKYLRALFSSSFFVTSALLLVLTHFGPSWISFKSFLVPPSGLLDLYFLFLAFSNDFHNFHDFIMFSVKSGPPIATTLCSQHKYCIFAWYCCKKTECMESWSKVIQEAKFKAQTTFHSFFWSLLHLCLF